MSARCINPDCQRAITEENWFCSVCWFGIRRFTKDRLLDMTVTAHDWLDARDQAIREAREHRRPGGLDFRGVGYRVNQGTEQ